MLILQLRRLQKDMLSKMRFPRHIVEQHDCFLYCQVPQNKTKKAFNCTLREKSFKCQLNLKYHIDNHLLINKKLYFLVKSAVMNSQQSLMKIHMPEQHLWTMSSQKTWSSPISCKVFRKTSNLKGHELTKHKKEQVHLWPMWKTVYWEDQLGLSLKSS